jgi:hypothetical protein
MHVSALNTGKLFFDTYVSKLDSPVVVDIGAQDVNGSLRSVMSPNVSKYVGVDFVEGKGVDVVLQDPYKYPFEDNTFDVLVTSSCYEHSELFWISFLEGMRVLKDTGLMYINAPSAWMMYHRYPVDCWRFWPDAGKGLETWSKYSGLNSSVLESYVCPPGPGEYVADFVCVMIKNANYINDYNSRTIDDLQPFQQYFNGFRFPINDKFPDGWNKPSSEVKQDLIWSDGNSLIIRR